MKRCFPTMFILILILSACQIQDIKRDEVQSASIPSVIKEDKIEEVSLVATGDLLFHQPIVKACFNGEGYDFSPCFVPIEKDLQEADIAIGNFEGTIDSSRKTSGFPRFNFPKETVASLKKVGFDVLSTANNHALDMGVKGIDETLETMEKEGIISVGTFQKNQRPPAVMEVRGVRIGFLAYTESLNGMDGLLPADEKYRINRFSEEVIKSDIESLKSHTDFVVILPHWGVEYAPRSNQWQQDWNQKFYQYGADMVLGSHPHVLQETVKTKGKAGDYFTIYSMGNGLSNQRVENLRRKGVETGVLVKVKIKKNFTTNKTTLQDVLIEPTYVHRYYSQGKLRYEIIKLKDLMEGGAYFEGIDNPLREKAKRLYQEAMDVLQFINHGEEKAA